MAKNDMNTVIGGKYEGYHIKSVGIGKDYGKGVNYAYLQENRCMLSNANVSSIQVVSQAGNHAIDGAIIAGTVGALVGTGISDPLIKIVWKNGGESILKVSSGMYELILATSYRQQPLNATDIINKNEKEDEKFEIGCFIVCAIAFIIFAIKCCD